MRNDCVASWCAGVQVCRNRSKGVSRTQHRCWIPVLLLRCTSSGNGNGTRHQGTQFQFAYWYTMKLRTRHSSLRLFKNVRASNDCQLQRNHNHWVPYNSNFQQGKETERVTPRQSKYYVRFEVFTAVTMKKGVFWDVTSCGSCKNRRFGGTWCLLHQGDKNRWTRNNTSCN
jgi:hypothetical protein